MVFIQLSKSTRNTGTLYPFSFCLLDADGWGTNKWGNGWNYLGVANEKDKVYNKFKLELIK